MAKPLPIEPGEVIHVAIAEQIGDLLDLQTFGNQIARPLGFDFLE